MKVTNMKRVLIKTSIFILLAGFLSNAYAEYYLVYSKPGCGGCYHRYHRCHHIKRHWYRRPCHPRSSYSLSVYYPTVVVPNPCTYPCGNPGGCGCGSQGYAVYTAQPHGCIYGDDYSSYEQYLDNGNNTAQDDPASYASVASYDEMSTEMSTN